MRIERITAQAVNRGIHEAHSRSPSSGAVTISYMFISQMSVYKLYLTHMFPVEIFLPSGKRTPSSRVCSLVRFRSMQFLLLQLLILFSFSCQFDLAFWAFLAPCAVEVGRWVDHGPAAVLAALFAAPVTLHCLARLSNHPGPYMNRKDLFEL